MKRFLGGIIIFVFALTLFPIQSVWAAGSNICDEAKAVCSKAEVGPFMQGITPACGNSGECELSDMMLVVANVGNWILGVIGAIVFLAYIIGGLMYIGVPIWKPDDRVSQAKKIMTNATIGLLIVMFAYIGIFTLKSVLISGSLDVSGQVACNGSNDGAVCGTNSSGVNSTCEAGVCTER